MMYAIRRTNRKRITGFLMAAMMLISMIFMAPAMPAEAATNNTYDDTMAFQVLDIVNREREAAGLGSLKMDTELMAVAKIRAEEITRSFSHTRPDGTSCFTVLDGISYWSAAENLAMGQTSPSHVMESWMNSAGHKRNILDEKNYGFNAIGVACYRNSSGVYYWVQIFAKKTVYEATRPSASTGSTGSTTTGNTTSTTVYNGVDYSAVYDYDYYVNNNPDVKAAFGTDKAATLQHFVINGMNEGRRAKSTFNVHGYKNMYADLRTAFGSDLKSYYLHYIYDGQREGRNGLGSSTISGYVTTYNGVNYAAVYDFNYYINLYPDLKAAFGNDDVAALQHFVINGMKEGRQAKSNFNVYGYKNMYADLRAAFGSDLKSYYLHYIYNGQKEGRSGLGSSTVQGYVTTYNGVNYASVYNFNYYINLYPDLKAAFGNNDAAALRHFVDYGMNEGRQASAGFNVYTYRARYGDLQAAFGGNLKSYYLHYLDYGIREGRSGK